MPEEKLVYVIVLWAAANRLQGKDWLLCWDGLSLTSTERSRKKPENNTADFFTGRGGSIQKDRIRSSEEYQFSPGNNCINRRRDSCHGDNMDFMLMNGLTVYLKMTPGQLAHRLMESTTVRPLIKTFPTTICPVILKSAGSP